MSSHAGTWVTAAAQPNPLDKFDPGVEVFIAIVAVVILSRLLTILCKRVGQPPVIGEILAGLLLGMSLLAHFHHGKIDLAHELFPSDVRPSLRALANLGLLIFMFIVGMDLDLKLIRGNERRAATISLSSIVVPFIGGILLGYALYSQHDQGGSVKKIAFVLFIGASMCVTAFPVLARILTDRGMQRTPLGTIALACAAIDDVVAWSLLALVSAIARRPGSPDASGLPLWQVLAFTVAYIAFMLLVVKPLLRRVVPLYQRAGRLTPGILAFLLIGLLLSAWATDKIGIHFIFGAFIFGTCVPREGAEQMIHEILERLEQVSVLLLLPMFFVITGLGVDVGALHASDLVDLLMVLAVAIGGKFLGAYLAARAQGLPGRRSQALALLMNTRGLTELVLLNIGRQLGVLDARLFSVLVIMAVVTTIMTSPLLKLVYPERILKREIAEAERAALGLPDAFRVLVVLDEPARSAALVDAAVDLVGRERPAQIILSLLRPQTVAPLEVGAGLTVEIAEMAGLMADLEEDAKRVRARGLDVAVLSRFSADPTTDVIDQVVELDADILLVAPGAAVDLDRLLERVDTTVAAWDGPLTPATGTVAALAAGGNSGDAAIALAARMVESRGEPLALVADGSRRRLNQLGERLTRHGIPTTVEAAFADACALVVVPMDAPRPEHPAGLLRVRAGRQSDQTELGTLLENLPQQASQPPVLDPSPPASG